MKINSIHNGASMLIQSYTQRVHICVTSHNVFQVCYTCISFYRLASFQHDTFVTSVLALQNIKWWHLDWVNTILTQMQDDSNLRWPPPKKYFTINFIHFIHKACQILTTFTNQCRCLYLHSQCLQLSHTHSLIPILFTVIPQHIIISLIHCIGYAALLKTLQSLLVRCTGILLWATLIN